MRAEVKSSVDARTYPNEWREAALEKVAAINTESLGARTPPAVQFKYIDIASVTTGLIDWSLVNTHQFATSPSRARRVVRPDDVLLCTVRPGLRAHAHADWPEREGYVCSTGFAVLRAGENMVPRFLYHLALSEIIASQVRRRETGTNYPAITESDVKSLRVPWPPLPEQRRITEILDAADAAIRETEALISKLERTKTGLTHDLLTRGLDERGVLRDPDAHPEQFKDSPLGCVPREWETLTFEQAAADNAPIGYGIVQPGPYVEPGVPVIAIHNLNKSYEANVHRSSHAIESRYARSRICAGDVLLSVKGTIGRVGIVPPGFSGNISRDIARIRLSSSAVPEYVRQMLSAPVSQRRLKMAVVGSTRDEISIGTLRRLKLLLPPVEEQRRIAEILDAHDDRIRVEETYRDKLKLQKAGLMEDLLTGKVRVSTAQEVGA